MTDNCRDRPGEHVANDFGVTGLPHSADRLTRGGRHQGYGEVIRDLGTESHLESTQLARAIVSNVGMHPA